jgi:NADH:ubiquinone reductase (H+-translocating)
VNAPLAIQLLDKFPTAEKPTADRRRVVIVGAGFSGIAAARALRRSDVDVILIDRRNHHIFQPLLYQVATSILAPSDVAAPVRQLVAKQDNLSVMLAEVTGIDLNSRTIDACSPRVGPRKIPFDFLVVATGVRPSYFGHDEFALYAPSLKNLSDAETIRAKILSAFEAAESTDDKAERARQMTFVLVGAGPTGVELAASMAHMTAHTLRGNFRRIDPAQSKIILVEAGNRILPTFAESLSKKAVKRLQKLGVSVETGVKVDRVDAQGVIAGGKEIPSATVLWTAGVAASPIVKMLGAKTDRAGRVSVGPFMNAPDLPGVFVIGDAASVMQGGRPVPGVAQAAIQQGRYVGRLISRQLKGQGPKRPFRYFNKGTIAVVGKNFAVLEAGWLRISGFVAWLAWVFVHLVTLPQLQNRLRVQRQWLWSYFTGQRSSRLISEDYERVNPAESRADVSQRRLSSTSATDMSAEISAAG